MGAVTIAKNIYAAIIEYERGLNIDPAAYLTSRIHGLEQEVAELKRSLTDLKTRTEDSAASL